MENPLIERAIENIDTASNKITELCKKIQPIIESVDSDVAKLEALSKLMSNNEAHLDYNDINIMFSIAIYELAKRM